MTSRIATDRTAKMAKMMKTPISPPQPLFLSPMFITMVQRTSDNSAKQAGGKSKNSSTVTVVKSIRPSHSVDGTNPFVLCSIILNAFPKGKLYVEVMGSGYIVQLRCNVLVLCRAPLTPVEHCQFTLAEDLALCPFAELCVWLHLPEIFREIRAASS